MFAYIPYVSANELIITIAGISLDPWSLLVSLGFILGLEVGRSRAIRLGLDIRDIVDGALFIIGLAFIFGHLVHVLAYNPQQIDEHGWIILLKTEKKFMNLGQFFQKQLGSLQLLAAILVKSNLMVLMLLWITTNRFRMDFLLQEEEPLLMQQTRLSFETNPNTSTII